MDLSAEGWIFNPNDGGLYYIANLTKPWSPTEPPPEFYQVGQFRFIPGVEMFEKATDFPGRGRFHLTYWQLKKWTVERPECVDWVTADPTLQDEKGNPHVKTITENLNKS